MIILSVGFAAGLKLLNVKSMLRSCVKTGNSFLSFIFSLFAVSRKTIILGQYLIFDPMTMK